MHKKSASMLQLLFSAEILADSLLEKTHIALKGYSMRQYKFFAAVSDSEFLARLPWDYDSQ